MFGSKTLKCLKRSRLRRSSRAGKGQATIEFALCLLPFFAILFAIIDYAQIYYYDNAMQNGLREAARFATAGRIIQNGTNYEFTNGVNVPQAINDSGNREASRNECIRYWFQSNCVIKIPASNIMIYSAPALAGQPPSVITNNGVIHLVSGSASTNAVPGPGNASDYVEIVATYPINTITPMLSWMGGWGGRNKSGGYPMRVSAIVKNEPALLNFQHTAIYSDEPNESPTSQMQ